MASGMGHNQITMLRQFVEQIERLNGDIEGLNDDKKEIYSKAKENAFNIKVLKGVIQERSRIRADAAKVAEEKGLAELYLAALDKQAAMPLMAAADEKAAAAAAAGEPSGPVDTPAEDGGTAGASYPDPGLARAHAREGTSEEGVQEGQGPAAVADGEDADFPEIPALLRRPETAPPAAPSNDDDVEGLFGDEPVAVAGGVAPHMRLESDQIAGMVDGEPVE